MKTRLWGAFMTTFALVLDSVPENIDLALDRLEVEKLVLVCDKKHLPSILQYRNDYAIKHNVPVEVEHFPEVSVSNLVSVLKKFNGITVCLAAKNPALNHYALSAAYFSGKKAFFFQDNKAVYLPVWSQPATTMLSKKRVKLLSTIKDNQPTTLTALSRINGFSMVDVEDLVLQSDDSFLSLGLVDTDEDNKVWLSEIGSLLLDSS